MLGAGVYLERVSVIKPSGFLEGSRKLTPLPPTSITPSAQERLGNWGIPVDFIDRLRSITSAFRYDLCPQKVERLTRRGGYIYQGPQREEVILPGFVDNLARQDGQCGDLALQLLNTLVFSGFQRELNNYLTVHKQSPVTLFYAAGLSRTHFNERERGSHFWLGVVPKALPVSQFVNIDPSFQEIATFSQSGYLLERFFEEPHSQIDLGFSVPVPIGFCEEDEAGNLRIDSPMRVVLGSSQDGKLVYELGFVRNLSGDIKSLIHTRQAFFNGRYTLAMIDNSGKTRWVNLNSDIGGTHRDDVEYMLQILQRLRLEPDQAKAEYFRNLSLTLHHE